MKAGRRTKQGSGGRDRRTKEAKLSLGEVFRARIASGHWKPNDKLPQEKELAEEFGVCAATIQRHLHILQREGLIWSHRGRGRFVASATRRPRTGNIGVVFRNSGHLCHPVMSEVLGGIGKVLAARQLNLNIFIVNGAWDAEAILAVPFLSSCGRKGILSLPAASNVDGLILLATLDPKVLEQLAAFLPLVTSQNMGVAGIPAVIMDLAAGAQLAMGHLFELGHRRIDLVTHPPDSEVGQAIRTGARLAAQQPRTPPADLRILAMGDPCEAVGREIARQILDRNPRATAVLCMDQLAGFVLDALAEAHIRVPEDLSFISWNRVHTERQPVGITSVCFDNHTVGLRRAERLLEVMDSAAPPVAEEEFYPPRLEIRASTAPPPSPV